MNIKHGTVVTNIINEIQIVKPNPINQGNDEKGNQITRQPPNPPIPDHINHFHIKYDTSAQVKITKYIFIKLIKI